MATSFLLLEPNNTYTDEGNIPSPTAHYTEPRWIAGEIMLLLITLVTVYIFVALMYYSWRFRHMARVSGSGQEVRERYLHYSCAAVILIAIARCILHQVIVFLPRHPGSDLSLCRSLIIAGRVVYNLAICLTYVHLWLRQHMFYTKKELKHLRTKIVEIVDWVVLVIIVTASAVLAFIAFIPMGGETAARSYHKEKCNAFEYNTKISLYLYAALSFTYQAILIALFLYPIIVQRINKKKEETNPNAAASNANGHPYPALWTGVRRGFILTVVVIITDAALGILVWILTKKYPDLLSSIIALNDVNLIFNVVCCICTFRNWRKIVFGFAICRKMGWHNDALLRSRKNASFKEAADVEFENNEANTSDNGSGISEQGEEKKILKGDSV